VTNPGKWEGCWTYPAYKPGFSGHSNSTVEYLPFGGFSFGGMSEGTFMVVATIPIILVIPIFAVIYSYCAAKKSSGEDKAYLLNN